MDPDELVLSDVHACTQYEESQQTAAGCTKQNSLPLRRATSRFLFSLTAEHSSSAVTEKNNDAIQTDEDGDLVVSRQQLYQKDVIVLDHSLETTLSDVGLQVWRGALLLADYILHQSNQFDGCVALELGAGVGLVSVVMGMFAKHVFCTDIGNNILENCESNAQRNNSLYRYKTKDNPVVFVKEFNWLDDDLRTNGQLYSWSSHDIEVLDTVTVILAADVVYNNELTDNFFTKVHALMSKRPAKVVYISIEKRLNFTLEDLDIACPAYEYFMACLDRFSELSSNEVTYTIQQITVNFPRYFQYERIKQLELWSIKAHFSGS